MKHQNLLSLLALTSHVALGASTQTPIAPADLVFAETRGLVAFKAEHYASV